MPASLLRLGAVLVVVAALVTGCTGSCGAGDGEHPETSQPAEPAPAGAGDGERPETSQPAESAPAGADPAHTTTPTELVAEHRALAREGEAFTNDQRQLYAKAYSSVGESLWRHGKRPEAEGYYREALRLWPDHAWATLRLADILAAQRRFKAAAEAYERAGQLDERLRYMVRTRRAKMARVVLAIADQRIGDGQMAGARQVLDFVLKYLGDAGADEARARIEQIKPLLRAQKLLAEAKEDIARFPKTEGFRKLRQVATDYPRTYFAQEANRLLEANGQKIVLHDTAGGYKLQPHWRRTSTAHFEVYYERQTGLTGSKRYAEQAYERIVNTFGMDDAEWKTRVSMYLFSDRESWREFLAMNPDRTEEWVGGWASPSTSEIYLYVTDRKARLYKRVLPHELTHVLHHRYVGGIKQPRWLKEGLAETQEQDGLKDARKAVGKRLKRGEVFGLRGLFGFADYPSDDVDLFYAQSATVVGFMIDEYGIDAFKEFMFAYASTQDTPEVIEAVYGISLDSFEEKWEKYVR